MFVIMTEVKSDQIFKTSENITYANKLVEQIVEQSKPKPMFVEFNGPTKHTATLYAI